MFNVINRTMTAEKKVSFGRIFWPSFWAALIVSVLGLIIWLIVISGIISSFDTDTSVQVNDKTILHMELNGEIGEKSSSKFDPMSFQMDNISGLADILYGLEVAKTDKKIKGVFIEIDNLSCGFATAKEIRDAINDFETSGKFVVAYNSGEVVTQKEYYIASAANENYGFHSSMMEFLGLGAEMMYFKNALDKMDIEMQVIRGSDNDFKSAVEPFFRTDMSDSSRVQVERYMEGLWSDFRADISKDRKVSSEELNRIAENALVQNVTDAVKYKLIDATKYRDEVIDLLAEKVKSKKGDDLELLAFDKYAKKKFFQDQTLIKADDPNVAVILAEGGVAKTGDGLTSEEICSLFQEARANKSVKTVVFRINSPGGSALASDEIWREVELTNKTKKVIVSMGDVAASGGYYIAAPASRIFAQSNTITGSIGVFGVIPFTGDMLENKLGLTFDRASTNKHAVMTTNRKLTEEEFTMIQKGVDDIYLQFKQRVAAGRGMTVEQVNVIARGRVWTGRDALKVGLVDELGGLKDAIAYAVKEAGIKDAKVLYYPIVKEDILGKFIEQLEESEKVKASSELPKTFVHYYNQLKKLESYQGIQMRMPYDITID
jgi:protease-4